MSDQKQIASGTNIHSGDLDVMFEVELSQNAAVDQDTFTLDIDCSSWPNGRHSLTIYVHCDNLAEFCTMFPSPEEVAKILGEEPNEEEPS